MIHSSLAFLVSGHAQQGFNFFFSSPFSVDCAFSDILGRVEGFSPNPVTSDLLPLDDVTRDMGTVMDEFSIAKCYRLQYIYHNLANEAYH